MSLGLAGQSKYTNSMSNLLQNDIAKYGLRDGRTICLFSTCDVLFLSKRVVNISTRCLNMIHAASQAVSFFPFFFNFLYRRLVKHTLPSPRTELKACFASRFVLVLNNFYFFAWNYNEPHQNEPVRSAIFASDKLPARSTWVWEKKKNYYQKQHCRGNDTFCFIMQKKIVCNFCVGPENPSKRVASAAVHFQLNYATSCQRYSCNQLFHYNIWLNEIAFSDTTLIGVLHIWKGVAAEYGFY